MNRTLRIFAYVASAFVGAAAGFVTPAAILYMAAMLLSWRHDDPAAGGVLSFLLIGIGPIGCLLGTLLATIWTHRKLNGGQVIAHSEDIRRRARRRFLGLGGEHDYRETTADNDEG